MKSSIEGVMTTSFIGMADSWRGLRDRQRELGRIFNHRRQGDKALGTGKCVKVRLIRSDESHKFDLYYYLDNLVLASG